MSSEIQQVQGRGLPLRGDDIDTDRIIPARFLRCVTFDGLGDHAFADDRSQLQGKHPFDNPSYAGASILVVNRNFGCGSSREHAPQALNRWGITAVVGESFAEIFFGNCGAIGVPCVWGDRATIEALQSHIETHPDAEITLDLNTLQVTSGDFSAAVTLKDGPRQDFLNGTWDSCGQLVAQADQVQATAQNIPYLAWT